MLPLFTAIFAILSVYFIYRIVLYCSAIYRRKKIANKLPSKSKNENCGVYDENNLGTDEHPICGVANIWAGLDTAGGYFGGLLKILKTPFFSMIHCLLLRLDCILDPQDSLSITIVQNQ